MITQPLNLRAHMRDPDLRFNSIPFLDVCLIALYFSVVSSAFIFAPGIAMDFKDFSLPRIDSGQVQGRPVSADISMISAPRGEMILFAGGRYAVEDLEAPLRNYVVNQGLQGSTLLIKPGRSLPTEDLLRLCDIARRVGFGGVQIAAEPGHTESLLSPEE